MKIEEATSSSYSSSRDTTKENYNWIEDNKFSSIDKEDYIKYPLQKWRDLVYDPEQSEYLVHSLGDAYQSVVNKVLKDDVFKDCSFFEDKNGMIKFNFNEKYNMSDIKFEKGFIAPDFFIYKIEVKKFFEILKQRSYMMRTSYKMNTKIKYISIIGEIKISHKRAHKKDKQKIDYLIFTKEAKLSEGEDILLMYVYDESFQLFKQDLSNKLDKPPYILCYIPKLYKEDCYHAFNKIADILNSKVEKINMNKPIRRSATKKELIKEFKNKEKFYLFIISISVLIISILIIFIVIKIK